MRAWTIALGVGVGASSACLVELDRELACGDGYVDELAGEECDPNVPESYEGACTNRPHGRAGCDPDSCEIIDDEQQCAHCGDGIIDAAAGEECDGSNVGVRCLGGGQPTCTLDCKIDPSTCERCGNGVLDPGEECDPRADGDDLAAARACAGTDTTAPLDSPNPSKPYTSGTALRCLDCAYDRRSCGYCGDGTQDGLLVDRESRPEVCDGEDFDLATLASDYPICTQLGARANVVCNDDCLGVQPRDPEIPCCLGPNTACPAEDDAVRCCFEYAHPEVAEPCLPVLLPEPGKGGEGGGAYVCR